MRFAPTMKMVCARYIKDRDTMSDVLQDAFIKIFGSIRTYREEGSLEGWMRRIVVTTAIDFLRKTQKQYLYTQNDEHLEIADHPDEDEGLIQKMLNSGFTVDLLLDMLNKIPPQYSCIFNLYYIDGLSHKEISLELGITENLSRKWVFRSRNMMKELLLDYLNHKNISLLNGQQG